LDARRGFWWNANYYSREFDEYDYLVLFRGHDSDSGGGFQTF